MSVKKIKYNEMMPEAIDQLTKGAFLTVKSNNKINTMTIGWGMIGYIWKKPVFQVLVRESRYTYDLIENSDNFTVSLPINEDLKEALKFCGTKSGRDYNKFSACHITPVESQTVDSPIVGECSLHYECKIVAKQRLNPEDNIAAYVKDCYSNNDYHTMYYGEIVDCYLIVQDYKG